ncbi:MAG: cardiolipin synthase [Oscillospiraceae bacterium]
MLIVIQLSLLVYAVVYLSSGQIYFFCFFYLLSILAVLYIISRYDNPSYKLAWIIPIMVFPIVGGLFYFLFGHKRFTGKLKKRMYKYNLASHENTITPNGCEEDLRKENPMLARQADYIYNISGFPLQRGTSSQYFPSGETTFEALKEELSRAEKFILMEYFIISSGVMWDAIEKILIEKAAQGVEVLLMYDDLGCIQTLPNKYDLKLIAKGIKVTAFNPFRPRLNVLMNNRDHRKICVIDGNVGFTGGINLADEYINMRDRFGHWKDTAILIKGDAVWSLTSMFLHLWEFSNGDDLDFNRYRPTKSYPSNGYVQPFGDSPLDQINVAENAYMQIINHSRKYLYICTPYLILDTEMLTALTTASASGIDVRIITPHNPDKWYVHAVTRSFYEPLLAGGVKIYEYTPGFIHAKMFVCDDEVAVVGTANMDFRSFYLHFECGACFYKSTIVGDVKQDFDLTLAQCKEYTLEDAKNVGIIRRFGRSLLMVFAPLM